MKELLLSAVECTWQ